MRTFWIADPTARLPAPGRFVWGSSEWAADSCLAAWSEFEREWTGASTPKRFAHDEPQAGTLPPPFLVARFVVFALGLGAFSWSGFRMLFG